MKYPVDAMRNLARVEACPRQLRETATAIANGIQPVVDSTSSAHREVEMVRVRYLRALARGIVDEVAMAVFERDAASVKSSINELMGPQAASRQLLIRDQLQSLPRNMRNDLCNYVRGVERFLDCGIRE
jgi:hypothetical protein